MKVMQLFAARSSAVPGGRAGRSPADLAALMTTLADEARDRNEHLRAAILYAEALRSTPDDAAIHIQCGHMFKEAGDLVSAEVHYRDAERLTPEDADLALQLGHFYKVAGRLAESARAYQKALGMRPDWHDPKTELSNLARAGWRGSAPALDRDLVGDQHPPPGRVFTFEREAAPMRRAAAGGGLVPEIAPRDPDEILVSHGESTCIRKLGRPGRSDRGTLPTLRGIESLRGFCISLLPIVELQIFLSGMLIHKGPVSGCFALHYERNNHDLRKYVFNVWHDFAPYSLGRHEIQLHFIDAERRRRTHREDVIVASPLAEVDHPDSDAVISPPAFLEGPIEDVINARPSVVRAAKRTVLPASIRNVLIVRTDQLGDMVTSIPAMRRLRELLPAARFVGLLTSSNAEFAATLGQLDEIITIDFPDDKLDRKRTMPLLAQEELRTRLQPYRFDVAIDLAESSMSRPLLLLSGAAFLYGFYDREWPWLSAGFEGNSHDVKNHGEVAAHSTRVLAFVERFGALLDSKARVVRREDLTKDRLRPYGISPCDRFAVLHAGARIEFSRWPHYEALAALLLKETGLKVLLIRDDPQAPGPRTSIDTVLTQTERFLMLNKRLPFDDFDAMLSFCSLFVGNDSGPKHLASLRGANVVSIHSARVNWSEWGQELTGSIISRKVPCAGCAIYHDADECGRGYTCVTNITPREVLDAAMKLLGG